MPKKKDENLNNSKKLPLKDYLEILPKPPKEHAHELKMEKKVKQLLKKQKNKQ